MGKRFFAVPLEAVPSMPLVRQLAVAPREDAGAEAALRDRVQEVFGDLPGLADSFREAARDKDRPVPGGKLEGKPAPGRPIPAVEVTRPGVKKLQKQVARLSKLQRQILGLARDYATT
jgi:hypothetical protein